VNPFYLTAHQVIYAAAMRMHDSFKPIDLLTMTAELRSAGQLESIGGPFALVELTNKVGSSANIEHHARIVLQKHIQRSIAHTSAELMQAAYDEQTDPLDLLERAEKAMHDFSTNLVQSTHKDAARAAKDLLTQAEAIRSGKAFPGLMTNFVDLDDYFQGIVPNELYVFAARPGMGKTAFMLSLARSIAYGGKKVGIFSLEMGTMQIMQRFAAQISGIDFQLIKNPKKLDDVRYREFSNATNTAGDLPIVIDDEGGLSLAKLKGKARAMRREGCEIIFIDYIQLVTNEKQGANREQEVSGVSRGLKALAKELNIPIVALSQLSRAVESRPGKRPQLADLRESGSIEQDAYLVGFLWRPEYYNIKETEDGQSTQGVVLIDIAKHRNGATGELFMRFTGSTMTFSDYNPGKATGFFPAAPGEDEDMPF